MKIGFYFQKASNNRGKGCREIVFDQRANRKTTPFGSCVESWKTFEIQIAGERVYIPLKLTLSSSISATEAMRKWKLN